MARIMIVDDDVFLHKVLERILAIGGHEIAGQAYNGAEAIETFSKINPRPDLILMDHRMPVMNGSRATRELKRIDTKVKIVFISADESVHDEAIDSGALDFLTKPIRAKTLFACLDEILSI
ncbi:MAG: response regulator [Candidatus Thorarchaeota archaeon]|nr:response regulator [Candidatus Thorarchaeota archaeon]